MNGENGQEVLALNNTRGVLDEYISFEAAPHSHFGWCHFTLSGKIFKRIVEDEDEDGFPLSVRYKFKNIGDKHFAKYGRVIYVDEDSNPFSLNIEGSDFSMNCDITPDAALELKRIIDEYIKSQARQKGRELTTIENLPLPTNVLGHIGSYLTGNKGSYFSQINQQKQKAGISLAPRASNKGKTMKRRK